MDLHFTWFDLAALAVLGISGVMGFARGLIREVFSIIAFVGGAIAGVFFADKLRPVVEQLTDLAGPLASVAAGLLIFLAVFIAITILTSVIAKTAHESTEIGSFDRAAGLAYGVLRGVLIVSLFVLLLRQAPADPRSPASESMAAITGARTYPVYDGIAAALEKILPQARDRARVIIDDRRQSESAPAGAPATPAPETP